MSDPGQPTIRLAGSLDPVSRHRAVWFGFRLCAFAALAFGPCLTSGRSFADAAALLSLACSLGGFISMLFARLSREPLGHGSLNGWDEAFAFVAASRLAHFAIGIPS